MTQYFVKNYGLLSFAKNMKKKHIKNVSKNSSIKYSQKRPTHDNKSATDALKTTSKRAIQKIAEATGDLIDNKIAEKSQKSHNLHHKIMV